LQTTGTDGRSRYKLRVVTISDWLFVRLIPADEKTMGAVREVQTRKHCGNGKRY